MQIKLMLLLTDSYMLHEDILSGFYIVRTVLLDTRSLSSALAHRSFKNGAGRRLDGNGRFLNFL